ncbi:zinc metalloprotease [Roseobacter sinensis]|uniref:Peptidase M10 metallopeptidase domain-containing protein n=1 Tax=Roseobacter sinensis TaxID=2931391 RepID=A0ABT3BKY9_9RHOB|nr:hypothetical protein [Roseobacter sp. WL0113]MCV3274234.1 hypothetical protein [Roseobacter sp. WL0113]
MISLRSVANSCLEVSGGFSVRRDVFGYVWGPLEDRSLSLSDHLNQISGEAFDITVILVGHEPGLAGWFDQDDVNQIQSAIDWAREIYAQAGLGIRRIYWAYIPTADANGYDVIGSGNEATDLTNDWSGAPADSQDVFYVTSVDGADGWSNQNGPCNKDLDKQRTGNVLQVYQPSEIGGLENRNESAGVLLAHEIGHYLGLAGGTDGDSNLMGADDDPPFGVDEISRNSKGITSAQITTILGHCSVKPPCA